MELHKYTDEEGIDILRNLRLKVSEPGNLNDPFELLARIDDDVITTDMVKEKFNNPDEIAGFYENNR